MARIAELAVVAAVVAAAACAPVPRACVSASECASGACHVGRCGAVDDLPIASGARRLVLSALAIRTTEDARYVAAVGGAASPTVFLRFAQGFGAARVDRAYLVLSPAPGAPASAERTTITVARALEPWTATSPAPRVGPVLASETVTFAPPRAIRVDVTEAVREWARGGEPHHGFVVRATSEGAGVAFAVEADEAPRLDVYVLADEPRRASDARKSPADRAP